MQAVSGTDAVSQTYGDGCTCGDDDRVRSYLGEDNPAAERVRVAAREHIGPALADQQYTGHLRV